MKKLITLILLLVGGVSMANAENYLVVGAAIVCNGENWNNDAAVNVMQTSDEGATYTLTIENLTLETGVNYEYKIVEKGSWDEYYPKTGHNASFSVDETAVYTITYTYTVSTSTCQVTKTKTGEAGDIEHTYNIAGDNITLFGASWDATNTATDMSDEDGDGIYTWENSDVTLTTGTIEFKVTVDHSWDVAYPSSNYQLAIPSDGTYKVTITFNEDTKAVSATAIKKNTYTVTFVNGKKWAEVAAYVWNGDGGSAVKIEGEWPGKQISKTGTATFNGESLDVYTYTLETYDDAPEKIIFNNNKAGESPEKEQTANLDFVDGKEYTDAVTFIPVYAVVGSNASETNAAFFDGKWNVATTTDLMTENEGIWSKTFSNVTLTENVIFRVIKKAYLEATTATNYYPSEFNITITERGKYNIVVTFDKSTENVAYTPTKLAEAVSVGEAGWATYKASENLDFSNAEPTGINAYTAKVNEGTVTLTNRDNVPQNEPVVLKADEGTYYVPVLASADVITNNDLQWFAEYYVNTGYYVYGLTKDTDGKARFALINTYQTVYNKAILVFTSDPVPSGARELQVVFEDETTGISQIENTQPATKTDGAIYNLNGQRVMNPGKGLYIINGKKFIMK